MRFPPFSLLQLLIIGVISCHLAVAIVHYDDEKTASKVQLEDLENEQEEIQQQQQQQQQQRTHTHNMQPSTGRQPYIPVHYARQPNIAYDYERQQKQQQNRYTNVYSSRPQPPQRETTGSVSSMPPQRQPQQSDQQQQQQSSYPNYATAAIAANHRYTSIGLNPYYGQTHNHIDADGDAAAAADDDEDEIDADHNDLAVRQRKQQLQHQQQVLKYDHELRLAGVYKKQQKQRPEQLQRQPQPQLSEGYEVQQRPPPAAGGALLLVPPFDEQNGIIEAYNPSIPPLNGPTAPYSSLPPPSAPSSPFYMDGPAVGNKYLPFNPPLSTIKYLSNNELAFNEGAAQTAAAIEYAREQQEQYENEALSLQRPPPPARLPPIPQRPPALQKFSATAAGNQRLRRPPPPFGYPVQSNQLAYAPAHPDRGPLPPHAASIPYPPSFISITTERPMLLVGRPYYARPRALEAAVPFEPVPDFFANRQAKSLLDSYIPSWEITKMIQQAAREGEPQKRQAVKREVDKGKEQATQAGSKNVQEPLLMME